jgi:hypothetical protein
MMKVLAILQIIIVGPAALALGLTFYLICFPCFLIRGISVEQEEKLKNDGDGGMYSQTHTHTPV